MNPNDPDPNKTPGSAPELNNPALALPKNQASSQDNTAAYNSLPYKQPVSGSNKSEDSPYDFIMHPPQLSKQSNVSSSIAKRILIVLGGLLALVVIGAVIVNILIPNDTTPQKLMLIAEEEQEIIRVATTIATEATGSDVRNLAINTQFSIGSNQSKTLKYITGHKIKMDRKLLGAKFSQETDALLKDAKAANTYDRTAAQTLQSQLVSYRSNLNATYKDATGKNARDMLKDSYAAAELLITQANMILESEQ